MSLELILVRHAKSDWSDTSLDDHDRPLNGRGAKNAPLMAKRHAEERESLDLPRVERIFSSTALRARTTAFEFGHTLGVDIELDAGLYMASDEDLFARAASSGVATVMIVAHHPGVSDLAYFLSRGGIEHMVTAAVARFVWHVDEVDHAARATRAESLQPVSSGGRRQLTETVAPMTGPIAISAWSAIDSRPADLWTHSTPR